MWTVDGKERYAFNLSVMRFGCGPILEKVSPGHALRLKLPEVRMDHFNPLRAVWHDERDERPELHRPAARHPLLKLRSRGE